MNFLVQFSEKRCKRHNNKYKVDIREFKVKLHEIFTGSTETAASARNKASIMLQIHFYFTIIALISKENKLLKKTYHMGHPVDK